MKKELTVKKILESLEKIPNISLACEKAGISRNTFYRWKNEDPIFARNINAVYKLGIKSVNDLSESKLVGLIQKSDIRAIKFWLENNKKNYARPRPKDFWSSMFPDERKVPGMRITIVGRDRVEREIKPEELKMENKKPQQDAKDPTEILDAIDP